MYCDRCRRELYYKDPRNKGWCFTCNDVVDTTDSRISFWYLLSVFTLLFTLQA